MEVTNTKERNSSVVMSAHDSIAVTIDSSAELMHVLSSSLYVNPRYAMVRETLCNAQDAHTEAGTTHIPIKVTMTDSILTIQDSGLGIPHERMGEIYGTFGKSTRKNNAGVTGGHGLGCKSPWSYADVFTVISCHEGIKTIYKMMKHDPEQDNKMGIKTVMQIPSTDTGLTVSINLKKEDVNVIHNALFEVVKFGEMNVLLNDETIMETYAFSKAYKGISFIPYSTARVHIRYGSVLYPLSNVSEDIDYYYDKLRYLAQQDRNGKSLSIVIQAEPDTLSVAPSRDNLTFDPVTTVAVQKLLKEAYLTMIGMQTDSVQNRDIKQLLMPDADTNHLLTFAFDRHLLREVYRNSRKQTNKQFYHTHEDLCLLLGHGNHSEKLRNIAIKEIFRNNYISPLVDTRLAKSVKWMDNHAQRVAWFTRNIYYPLTKVVDKLDERCYIRAFSLSTKALFIPRSIRRMMPTYESSMLLSFIQKRIVITTRVGNLHDRLPHGVSSVGLMVLVVPRDKNTATQAEKLLKERGYYVHNLAIDVDLPEYNQRQAELKLERAMPKEVVKKPTTGFPSLYDCYFNGTVEYARGNKMFVKLMKPIAYITVGKTLLDEHYSQVKDLLTYQTYITLGEDIAVIRTLKELNEIEEMGVPPLRKYLMETRFPNLFTGHLDKVTDHLLAVKLVKECVDLAQIFKRSRVDLEDLKHISNVLKIKGNMSNEIRKELQLLETFISSQHSLFTSSFNKLVDKYYKLRDKKLPVPISKKLSTIYANPLFACINLEALDSVLSESDKNSQVHKNAIKLTKSLLQGYDND